MIKPNRVVDCDVLVVGGAGAAVMTALRAAQKGARVALVSKGKVGKSGNTVMIGGGFGIDGKGAADACGEPDANPAYTPQALLDKLRASGFDLGDTEMQRAFVEEAPAAVSDCLNWAKAAGQLFQFNPQTCSWRTSGAAFGKTVKQGLNSEPGIDVYEDTAVVEVLKAKDGAACGALAIEIYSGETVQFRSKATVLATGGFQPFSLKNSNTDMTGDGIGMALRAGASVRDMEFLLFIPTVRAPRYAEGSILPFLMTMPALFPLRFKVTDMDGEELVFPDSPRFRVGPTNSKVNKLLMNCFWGEGLYKKWNKYGNNFYYDFGGFTDEEIREAFVFFAGRQKAWHRDGYYNGIDLAQMAEDIIRAGKRLHVAFGNEYSMGGVVVNADHATQVPGLFAAGEVTGGTFGAFRSGDGLTEMLAHGAVAGAAAAEYAAHTQGSEADTLGDVLRWALAPLSRKTGVGPVQARKELEQICDSGFDFYRDGVGLERASREITALRQSLKIVATKGKSRQYNREWIEAFAVQNLALCAEIGIYSALNREESRGCHLRADYREVNEETGRFNWLARLGDEGEIWYEKRPVAALPKDAPKRVASVEEYIAQRVLEG